EAMDGWDNLVWLDELYDLTRRVPDINAIQITQFKADPYVKPAAGKAGASKASGKGPPPPHYAARGTNVGKKPGKNKSQLVVYDLYNQFRKEAAYYSPETPEFKKDTFTLVVNARRRPPSEYKGVLPALAATKEAPAKGKKK